MPISVLPNEPPSTSQTSGRSARDDPPYRITPTAPNKDILKGFYHYSASPI